MFTRTSFMLFSNLPGSLSIVFPPSQIICRFDFKIFFVMHLDIYIFISMCIEKYI